MKSGKIVKKFFSKSEAEKAATYQRTLAKKEGRVLLKVEVLNAYELYQRNGWFKGSPFKSLGAPCVDQYMVIVYYNLNVVPVKSTSSLKKKVVKASKLKSASVMFKVLRLTAPQLEKVKSIAFNYVSNFSVPAYRFRYRSTRSANIEFVSAHYTLPVFSYPVAA